MEASSTPITISGGIKFTKYVPIIAQLTNLLTVGTHAGVFQKIIDFYSTIKYTVFVFIVVLKMQQIKNTNNKSSKQSV